MFICVWAWHVHACVLGQFGGSRDYEDPLFTMEIIIVK